MRSNANIAFKRVTLFLLLFLMGGCAPMAEIDIQVMQPARITLPANVQQIAFMNRSVVPYLLQSDSTEWTEEEFFILDTIMNNRISQGIMESMRASPLFDLDTLKLIRVKRYDTTGSMEALSPLQMQKFKEVQPADALLSLEYYSLKDSVHVKRTFVDYDLVYEAYFGIITSTIWRVYDLNMETVIDEYTLHDTVDWYSIGEIAGDAIENLPRAIDAIRDAAFRLGTIYGERISPTWQQVSRYYYKAGGREMRKAGRKAASEDWLKAAEIWKILAYGENKKTAANASFNMALICEIEDLIIPALDWATKSYLLNQKSLTKDYIELLQQRNMNRKKLEDQVPSGVGD